MTCLTHTAIFILNYRLSPGALAVAVTNTEATPRITPRDSTSLAPYATGPAFETGLPSEGELSSVQTIVLYRADMKTRFLAASFAYGSVENYVRSPGVYDVPDMD